MTSRVIPLSDITDAPLDAWEWSCSWFAPSEDPQIDALAANIAEIGLLQPLLLVEEEPAGPLHPLVGARRLAALRATGAKAVPALVLPSSGLDVATRVRLWLASNKGCRPASPVEKGRAARRLLLQHDGDASAVARRFSAELEIPGTPAAVEDFAAFALLPDPVKTALHTGTLSTQTASFLLPLRSDDQLAFVDRIISRCQPNRNEARELLEMLLDLATGADKRLSPYLESETLRPILDRSDDSPKQRCARLRETLFKRRYPEKAERRARIAEQMRFVSRSSNGKLQLNMPRHFENDRLGATLSIGGGSGVSSLHDLLGKADVAQALAEIQKLMSGSEAAE